MMDSSSNTRVSSIFFLFVGLYAIVLFNLFILQIRQHHFFVDLAHQQYQLTVTKMPPRAEIVDRNDTPLATNKESLAAFIIPNHLEEPTKLKSFLKKHFPAAHDRLAKQAKAHFMYVKRRITAEQLELIESSQLADIKLLKEPSRYYTLDSLGPIVGMTDIDNVGVMGIELQANAQLAGKASTYVLQKDARSGHFYFKKDLKVPGVAGTPVQLTLDGTLQYLAYEELKDAMKVLESKEGAVLILNPDNGEILAMATYPDFDPNNTEHLNLDTTKNRVVADVYELGSVVKAFLALAALEEGVVTPDELIDCENSKSATINGVSFTTWKAHGVITFSEVIQGSNNIGTTKVALRLQEKLYQHYKRLGFEQKVGTFLGENRGFINPPHKWSRASIVSLSFGYEISANLLQLARAFSLIANGGYLITPHLIKQEKLVRTGPYYRQETIDTVREILQKTLGKSNLPVGSVNGYTIMGKTGTARLITNGTYDPTRHIYTFAGIVEKGNYKRVIITFVKETSQRNAYASTTAAPLFSQVMQKMLIHDKMIA